MYCTKPVQLASIILSIIGGFYQHCWHNIIGQKLSIIRQCLEETHTYLKVVVIQEQSGEVCESPQLRTQVSDWSSYLQLCPVGPFRVITILSYHFAIQSS